MKKTRIFLLCITLIVMLSACSVTTANFSDLEVSSDIDNENKPLNITDTFATNAPMIYVSGILKNAPEGTVIKSEWYYVENDPAIAIDNVSYEIKEITTAFQFNLSKPNNDWPTGKYEVKLYIDDTLEETLNFIVE